MASPSSGRYQSRLFNFVHQQSRLVSERLGRAFRHLQVATSWGLQVLLYPIYLLFQSTKLSGKQLNVSAAPQSQPQLPADDTDSQPHTHPTADTPIQRVLLLVDVPAEEPVANLPNPKTLSSFLSAFSAHASRLNGDASRLRRETLLQRWLGNPRTALAPLRFKFFTPSEIHQLKKPEASASNSNRPVVRGIATQLSNRTLVLVTAQNEIFDILTPQQQQKLQEQIIGEMASYWRHQRELGEPKSSRLAPVSEVAITSLNNAFAVCQRSWKHALALKTQLTVFLSGKVQPDGIRKTALTPDASETHTLKIQALIWAAIDYFFGNRGMSELGQTTSTDSAKKLPVGSSTRPKHLHSADVDSWLTLSDLFGTAEEESSQNTQIEPAPEWIETHATAVGYVKHPLEQLLEWLDRAMLWIEELLVRVLQWVRSSSL